MTQFENPSKNFNLSKNQKFAMFLFSSLTNEQKRKKIIKKEKFHTLSLNVTWSIEMKSNTIFMYDAYSYDMYNYDNKYNLEFAM